MPYMEHMKKRWVVQCDFSKDVCRDVCRVVTDEPAPWYIFEAARGLPFDDDGKLTAQAICDMHNAGLPVKPAKNATPLKFRIGDYVSWPKRGRDGAVTSNLGEVVDIVPAGTRPVLPHAATCGSSHGFGRARDHDSYFVRKLESNSYYWPRVSQVEGLSAG